MLGDKLTIPPLSWSWYVCELDRSLATHPVQYGTWQKFEAVQMRAHCAGTPRTRTQSGKLAQEADNCDEISPINIRPPGPSPTLHTQERGRRKREKFSNWNRKAEMSKSGIHPQEPENTLETTWPPPEPQESVWCSEWPLNLFKRG